MDVSLAQFAATLDQHLALRVAVLHQQRYSIFPTVTGVCVQRGSWYSHRQWFKFEQHSSFPPINLNLDTLIAQNAA